MIQCTVEINIENFSLRRYSGQFISLAATLLNTIIKCVIVFEINEKTNRKFIAVLVMIEKKEFVEFRIIGMTS